MIINSSSNKDLGFRWNEFFHKLRCIRSKLKFTHIDNKRDLCSNFYWIQRRANAKKLIDPTIRASIVVRGPSLAHDIAPLNISFT